MVSPLTYKAKGPSGSKSTANKLRHGYGSKKMFPPKKIFSKRTMFPKPAVPKCFPFLGGNPWPANIYTGLVQLWKMKIPGAKCAKACVNAILSRSQVSFPAPGRTPQRLLLSLGTNSLIMLKKKTWEHHYTLAG